MGLPAWVIRKIANGEAPGPYYAGVGLFDASRGVPMTLVAAFDDPTASLSGLRAAWRDPVGHYDALVKRGYVRVVSDGAEIAVRGSSGASTTSWSARREPRQVCTRRAAPANSDGPVSDALARRPGTRQHWVPGRQLSRPTPTPW